MKETIGSVKRLEAVIRDILMAVLFVCMVSLAGCASKQESGNSNETNVTVTFVGDIMMHRRQLEKTYTGEGFDVDRELSYVEDYLRDSDYTVGNLETTLAGAGNGPNQEVLGYAGFPNFNSPDDLAYALKDAGFDLLQTANNHCMDTGLKGLERTIDVLDDVGIDHVGTAVDQAECDKSYVVSVKGIRIGWVAYTFEINAGAYVTGAQYIMNSLHSYDEEYVSELYDRIAAVKKAGADIVCVLIHWGNEYDEVPDTHQRELADGMFEHGADLIIGGHPHVVQPVEHRVVTDSEGRKRDGYVFYSLGDFLSSAVYDNDGVNKDIGLMAQVVIARDEQNHTCRVASVNLVPTHIYETRDNIGVVAVPDALKKKSSGDGTYDFLSEEDWDRVEYAQHMCDQLINQLR